MPDVVVDNSVALKWYLPEEHAHYAVLLLSPDLRRHAPDLLVAEMTNVLWRKAIAGGITHEEAMQLVAVANSQDVQLHALAPLMQSALDLAIAANHPAYDCFYLALALQLEGICVTADRRFYNAFAERYPGTIIWIEDFAQPDEGLDR